MFSLGAQATTSPATRLKPVHATAELLLLQTKLPLSFPGPDGWFTAQYPACLMRFPSVNADLSNHSASNILWKGGIKSFISHTKVPCGIALPQLLWKAYWKSSICVKGRWVEEKKGVLRIWRPPRDPDFDTRTKKSPANTASKILNLRLLDDCTTVSSNFIWRICFAIDVKQKKNPLYLSLPQAKDPQPLLLRLLELWESLNSKRCRSGQPSSKSSINLGFSEVCVIMRSHSYWIKNWWVWTIW